MTTTEVLLRVVVIIVLAEFLIMLVMGAMPFPVSAFSLALIDVMLLAALTVPALYLWVIKPFVDARDAALAQLSDLASTDPLTQLANRRVLLEHIEKVITGSVRHRIPAALLLIDLDGFKQINDLHGHGIGDAVLVETAARIQSVTRSEDVASRWGGDEFVLVINRLDPDERRAAENAMRTAEKLIRLVDSPVVVDGQSLRVAASIGIRLLGFDELDAKTALGEADVAMYRAKQAGRGGACLYET